MADQEQIIVLTQSPGGWLPYPELKLWLAAQASAVEISWPVDEVELFLLGDPPRELPRHGDQIQIQLRQGPKRGDLD